MVLWIFKAKGLRILLQLESFHLEFSRLRYDKNKNMSFRKILTVNPLIYLHVSLHIFCPYPWTISNQTKTRSKEPQNSLKSTKTTQRRDEFGYFSKPYFIFSIAKEIFHTLTFLNFQTKIFLSSSLEHGKASRNGFFFSPQTMP